MLNCIEQHFKLKAFSHKAKWCYDGNPAYYSIVGMSKMAFTEGLYTEVANDLRNFKCHSVLHSAFGRSFAALMLLITHILAV